MKRITSPLSALVVVSLLSLGTWSVAVAQTDGGADRTSTEPPALKVYRVKWADAADVAQTIAQIGMASDLKIAYDARTNSIIVTARPGTHERITSLLSSLDVETSASGDDGEQVRAFPLRHAVADGVLAESLVTLYASGAGRGRSQPQRALRIANDLETNQIIARGSSRELDTLTELIQALDSKPADPVSPELQVRLVWLVNGVAGDRVRAVPRDLGGVLEELENIGIEGLELGAQSVVRVRAGEKFSARFMTKIDDVWSISISGTADGAPGGVRTLTLALDGVAETTGMTHLETSISTRSGQYVVLGVSPIQQMDSVFVIQISDV